MCTYVKCLCEQCVHVLHVYTDVCVNMYICILTLGICSLELASEKSWRSIFLITKVSPINEQFLTVNLKVKFV